MKIEIGSRGASVANNTEQKRYGKSSHGPFYLLAEILSSREGVWREVGCGANNNIVSDPPINEVFGIGKADDEAETPTRRRRGERLVAKVVRGTTRDTSAIVSCPPPTHN